MTDVPKLHDLADLLEQAADTLALFAHHAEHNTEALDDTRQLACRLAMDLMPDTVSIANVGGLDTRRLRHVAASSLLRLSSLARTRGVTSIVNGAFVSHVAGDLMAAAGILRLEAAGLE